MISDPFGLNPRPKTELQRPMPRPTAAGLLRPATAELPRPTAARPIRPATVEPIQTATAEPHRPAITGLPRPAFSRPPPQKSYGTIPMPPPGNNSFRFADVRMRDDPNLPIIVENANGPSKKDMATQCSGVDEIRRSLGRGTMIREGRDYFAHVGSRQ